MQNLVCRVYSRGTCAHIPTHTHAHPHAHTTHQYTDYTKLNLHTTFTDNRDLRQRKTAAWNGKHGRCIVLEKEKFWGLTWMSPERVPVREEGEGHSTQRGQDRKGTGTNSEMSGARNLEAESIRSKAESAGGCVKVKTVTEIRQGSAHNTSKEGKQTRTKRRRTFWGEPWQLVRWPDPRSAGTSWPPGSSSPRRSASAGGEGQSKMSATPTIIWTRYISKCRSKMSATPTILWTTYISKCRRWRSK